MSSCLALARAILWDTRVRRQWMFTITLGVMAFVFGGYFLFSTFLQRHAILFACYLILSVGGLCFLTAFAAFDLLVVRREYLKARRDALREATRDLSPATPEHAAAEDRSRS